jgi:hypothetical protein
VISYSYKIFIDSFVVLDFFMTTMSHLIHRKCFFELALNDLLKFKRFVVRKSTDVVLLCENRFEKSSYLRKPLLLWHH